MTQPRQFGHITTGLAGTGRVITAAAELCRPGEASSPSNAGDARNQTL